MWAVVDLLGLNPFWLDRKCGSTFGWILFGIIPLMILVTMDDNDIPRWLFSKVTFFVDWYHVTLTQLHQFFVINKNFVGEKDYNITYFTSFQYFRANAIRACCLVFFYLFSYILILWVRERTCLIVSFFVLLFNLSYLLVQFFANTILHTSSNAPSNWFSSSCVSLVGFLV